MVERPMRCLRARVHCVTTRISPTGTTTKTTTAQSHIWPVRATATTIAITLRQASVAMVVHVSISQPAGVTSGA